LNLTAIAGLDAAAALKRFRETEGCDKYEMLEMNSSRYKDLKRRALELATTINGIKRRMDELQRDHATLTQLQVRCADRPQWVRHV